LRAHSDTILTRDDAPFSEYGGRIPNSPLAMEIDVMWYNLRFIERVEKRER
jgi:hypothetical protein